MSVRRICLALVIRALGSMVGGIAVTALWGAICGPRNFSTWYGAVGMAYPTGAALLLVAVALILISCRCGESPRALVDEQGRP